MGYLGKEPVGSTLNYIKIYLKSTESFDGIETTFNLVSNTSTDAPAELGSAENLEVLLDNARIEPYDGLDGDYTINGSQITFIVAPTGGTSFFGIRQAQVESILVTGDNTVTRNKLSGDVIGSQSDVDNGVAGTLVEADKLSTFIDTNVKTYGDSIFTNIESTSTTPADLIARDDTKPQSTEGIAIIASHVYTPKYTGGTIRVNCELVHSKSVVSTAVLALFKDAAVDAVAVGVDSSSTGIPFIIPCFYEFTGGVEGVDITFMLRAGVNTGLLYVNKSTVASLYDTLLKSGLYITEFPPN